MKKTQGIKWEKKGQVRQIPIHDKKPLSFGVEKIATFLLWYMTILLLGFGTLQIYGDVFSLEESKKSCILVLFLFCSGLVAGYEFFPKKKIWNRILFIGFIAWGVMRFRQIMSGSAVIVNEILHFVNDYYTVHLPDIRIWDEEFGTVTEAHLFLMGLMLWQMAYALFQRRNRFFALLPGALLFGGELLVGFAAGWLGILCYLLGACSVQALCQGAKAEKSAHTGKGRFLVAGILMISLLLTFSVAGIIGSDSAEAIVAKQGRMLAYQRYVEQTIVNCNGFSTMAGESGKVNNHTPLYLNKEVLKVTVSNKVRENIYLRGYVGDTYQNGNWKNKSVKLFAAQEWEDSTSEDAGYEILNQLYTGQKSAQNQGTFSITYVSTGNHYAYFPYYTDSESLQGELSIQADSMLFRKKQQEMSVDGLVNQSLFTILENGKQETETAVEQQYENYLELYLQVPDGLDELDELGTKLLEQLEAFGAEDDSLLRSLAAVCLVRDAVNERVAYSKNLDHIPAGDDVVEYFLFESGEGYCTHYASAGVLLFRELGIPSRYVTGYVADKDDFESIKKGTYYEATVLDSDAHAWVEIYITGIGWVPIEMIEGFDSKLDSMSLLTGTSGKQAISFLDGSQNWEIYAADGIADEGGLEDWFENIVGESITKVGEVASIDDAGDMVEDSSTDTSQSDTLAEQETDVTKGTLFVTEEIEESERSQDETEMQNTEELSANGNQGISEKLKYKKSTTKIVIIVSVSVLGVLLCIAFFIGFSYGRKKKVLKSFCQKNRRKAIQSITTQMYRNLKKKGIFTQKEIDDKAFLDALRNQTELFTEEEVDRLRNIMEQAAFSQYVIVKQDVEYCRKMYRKLLK